MLAACLGLLWSLVFPLVSSGVQLCWFLNATGIPCPGCGLTRSLNCALRGMFGEAARHHPMGLFVVALFLFTVVHGLLPKPLRDNVGRRLDERAGLVNSLHLGFVIAFVSFGVLRAVIHFLGD